MKEKYIMNRVKEYRTLFSSLTQSELAKQVGITRQTMYLIENNKYNPTIKVCLLLAHALNTSVDKLFWLE